MFPPFYLKRWGGGGGGAQEVLPRFEGGGGHKQVSDPQFSHFVAPPSPLLMTGH